MAKLEQGEFVCGARLARYQSIITLMLVSHGCDRGSWVVLV
ncbi:MAG: hypothetical protein N2595_00720 [bacterium]|nr:hypothetical protein [bacterium]